MPPAAAARLDARMDANGISSQAPPRATNGHGDSCVVLCFRQQGTHNPLVAGSIPAGPTTPNRPQLRTSRGIRTCDPRPATARNGRQTGLHWTPGWTPDSCGSPATTRSTDGSGRAVTSPWAWGAGGAEGARRGCYVAARAGAGGADTRPESAPPRTEVPGPPRMPETGFGPLPAWRMASRPVPAASAVPGKPDPTALGESNYC